MSDSNGRILNYCYRHWRKKLLDQRKWVKFARLKATIQFIHPASQIGRLSDADGDKMNVVPLLSPLRLSSAMLFDFIRFEHDEVTGLMFNTRSKPHTPVDMQWSGRRATSRQHNMISSSLPLVISAARVDTEIARGPYRTTNFIFLAVHNFI